MECFIFFHFYIVLVTLFLPTDAQNTGLNIRKDLPHIPEKNSQDESSGIFQENELINFEDNNRKIQETRPLNPSLDSKRKLNKNNFTSKHKSVQIPLNFVIDTKLRRIPIKIPLDIKTANAKPAPAHYIRLKGNPDRINFKPKTKNDSHSNEKTRKLTPTDKVRPNSTNKSFRKHKPNSYKFFEDDKDSNNFLLPEPKVAKPKKHKKLEHKKEFKVEKKLQTDTQKELSHDIYENEIVCDCNKTVNIEDETHSILISKLPLSIQHKIELKEPDEALDKQLQEKISHETPVTLSVHELEIIATPISNKTVAVAVHDYDNNLEKAVGLCDNKYIEPIVEEKPIDTVDLENESSEFINIKDHNYQEIEERRLLTYPEEINVDECTSKPFTNEALNPIQKSVSTNPYEANMQNYQTDCGQHIKNMNENNLSIYNEGNFYHGSNAPEPLSTYMFLSPVKQVVQDIYGPNPKSNIINIRPENSVGRIWRTWKDINIKISKPKYVNNGRFQLGRNGKDVMGYSEVIAKTPVMSRHQSVSLDGYYNNLNNMWPYPYSCQSNKYIL